MNKKRPWLYPALWAILIFILSSFSDVPGSQFLLKTSDKILHILLYLPLGYLLSRAMNLQPGPFKGALAFWAIFFGIIYGLTDEIHQYFVPGRSMDIADLGADAIGVFIGGFFYYLVFEILKNHK